MKKHWLTVIMVGILSLSMSAQSGSNDPSPANTDSADAAKPTLSPGDYVTATLSKSLDAGKAKIGDPVMAEVIPNDARSIQGAKLVGHISDVHARNADSPESRLTIVFDKAILKGGAEIPFTAVISTATPVYRSPTEQRKVSRIEQGGVSAQDRAAGPVPTGPGEKPGAVTRTPTVLENQIDNMHMHQTGASGMQDVNLSYDPTGSIFVSAKRNVKVEKGTTLTLQFLGSSDKN